MIRMLTAPEARDYAMRLRVGLPVPTAVVEALLDSVKDAIDALKETDNDALWSATEIAGAIRNLEEQRKVAVEEKDEAEEERRKEHGRLLDRVDALVEEKAALERQLKEPAIGAQPDAKAHEVLERANARITELIDENFKVKQAMNRGAEFWREKAREELAGELERLRCVDESSRVRAAELETARLRRSLEDIAKGPKEDAHRLVRVAIGCDVLEKSGTAAREGYVRRSRKTQGRTG